MIVCHCEVVSDGDVRAAIAAGATNESSVAAACGTSLHCGGCLPAVRELLLERGLPVDELLDAAAIRARLVAAAASVRRAG